MAGSLKRLLRSRRSFSQGDLWEYWRVKIGKIIVAPSELTSSSIDL